MAFQSLDYPNPQVPAQDVASTPLQTLTSVQSIVESSIEIFKQPLKNEWRRQRVPQGLKKKFLETRTGETATTARIFLDHGGFTSWIAHFLSTGGKAHFKGRRNRSFILKAFDELSWSERRNAAKVLAATQLHPTVHNAILRILQSLRVGG
jgi:hypothetical protein